MNKSFKKLLFALSLACMFGQSTINCMKEINNLKKDVREIKIALEKSTKNLESIILGFGEKLPIKEKNIKLYFKKLSQTVLSIYEKKETALHQAQALDKKKKLQNKQLKNNSSKKTICVICQDEIKKDSKNKEILSCGHQFHKDCIKQWLNTEKKEKDNFINRINKGLGVKEYHRDCPICRKTIKYVSEEEKKEKEEAESKRQAIIKQIYNVTCSNIKSIKVQWVRGSEIIDPKSDKKFNIHLKGFWIQLVTDYSSPFYGQQYLPICITVNYSGYKEFIESRTFDPKNIIKVGVQTKKPKPKKEIQKKKVKIEKKQKKSNSKILTKEEKINLALEIQENIQEFLKEFSSYSNPLKPELKTMFKLYKIVEKLNKIGYNLNEIDIEDSRLYFSWYEKLDEQAQKFIQKLKTKNIIQNYINRLFRQ